MKNNFDIINNTNYDVNGFKKSWHLLLDITQRVLKIPESLELTLSIITPDESLKLNQTYRQRDYIADVLAFSLEQDTEKLLKILNVKVLGDIFICYEKAKIQAEKYEHSLTRELGFLFVHGLLHLLGYDHQTKTDEDIMFGLQDEILETAKINRFKEEHINEK